MYYKRYNSLLQLLGCSINHSEKRNMQTQPMQNFQILQLLEINMRERKES